MPKQFWFIVGAVAFAVMIPLLPAMLRLRITIFRKLHWDPVADWHERNFRDIIVWLRLTLAASVVICLVLAF